MSASFARNFVTVILIAFASAALFCAWSVSATSMDEPMNDCAIQQSQLALCSASPQEHLTWKNFLPVTPQKVLNFLLASLLLAVGLFISRSWLHAPPLVGQYFRTKIREGLSIIDPIRRVLSRGIIQPQIYEIAIG